MAQDRAESHETSPPGASWDPFDPSATAEIAAATKTAQPRRDGPDFVRGILTKGVDLLVARLQAVADDKPDGKLSLADIHVEAAALKADAGEDVTAFCRRNWDRCLKASASAQWEDRRTNSLGRILLGSFAHLLAPVGEPPIQGKHLSRDIIDPFLAALQLLLGPERYASYQNGCDRMVLRLRRTHGADFAWSMVTENPTSETVVNDILVYISRYFTHVPKRRRWMTDLMSQEMPAAGDQGAHWQFGDREFHMLMDALYFGLRNALDSDIGKQSLVRRYDHGAIAMLYSMLQALDRDYMEVIRKDAGS